MADVLAKLRGSVTWIALFSRPVPVIAVPSLRAAIAIGALATGTEVTVAPTVPRPAAVAVSAPALVPGFAAAPAAIPALIAVAGTGLTAARAVTTGPVIPAGTAAPETGPGACPFAVAATA